MAELKIKRCVVGMISTNCYIVYKAPQGEENPCIIIDPGDNASYLAKLCRDEKLKPEAILLTHGHFDHMMAADELRRTFQIPIYAGEKEVELLADPDMNVSKLGGECVSLNGDTLFDQSVGRTDLPTGSGRAIVDSVTRVLFALPDDVMLYPGHGDETSIGYEKLHNPVAHYAGR